jgi:hypothetical protein
VFDPAGIHANATADNPNQFSAGIELVVVNGKPAWQRGHAAAKNGKPVRY